jgi:flavin reductase (DIM6/NTAB) family NADH-FMN oxidoreductase RutF
MEAAMLIDPEIGMRPSPLKHNPFKALVAPRPIGWIATISKAGQINLAPFSYFNAVADTPPCVMFCPNGAKPDGSPKDSLVNVEETGEFVFNIATWATREQMNLTSAHEPRSVDEMAKVGLTAVPSVKVKPPRVAESPVHFECRHLQTVEMPEGKRGVRNFVVFGQVVALHVSDEVVTDGLIDYRKLRPIARLGYMDYCVVDEHFSMQRPD